MSDHVHEQNGWRPHQKAFVGALITVALAAMGWTFSNVAGSHVELVRLRDQIERHESVAWHPDGAEDVAAIKSDLRSAREAVGRMERDIGEIKDAIDRVAKRVDATEKTVIREVAADPQKARWR